MIFTIETEQETDTRWIAEILELAGVLAYDTIPHPSGAQPDLRPL